MEFHPADYENYVKITGNDPTPEAHAAYVELIHVRHMFVSGELGYDHLISMVARLGIPFQGAPKPLELQEGQVDWSSIPGDGSVVVEVQMFGGWQPGVYWGRIDGGTLGVEMDDNPGKIVEMTRSTPDIIRLSSKKPYRGIVAPGREDMDARARAIEDEEESAHKSLDEDIEEDEELVVPEVDIDDQGLDWSVVSKGVDVYIEEEDGEIKTGSFVGITRVAREAEGDEEPKELTKIVVRPEGEDADIEYFEGQVIVADLGAVTNVE